MHRFIPVALCLATLSIAASADAAVLDVRQFGARANDGRDDAHAIRTAVAQARPGDVVHIPAGIFEVGSTISMRSHVSLAGIGCGRSILRRGGERSGQIMLKFDGVDRVGIERIQFDYNGAPEFYRAVGFRASGSQNISIAENCFFEHNFRGGRGDRWAIELSATKSPSRNIDILRNEVRGNLQLTAGGGAGILGANISHNRVMDARANGIALSTLHPSARFNDINISYNTIITPAAIGIFIGPDQPRVSSGRFNSITVANNRVLGLRDRFAYGLLLRAPGGGMSNVDIVGNEFDGKGSPEATAIRFLDDHGRGTRRFSDVRICDNDARNFGRGVWLQRVFGAVVTNNRMQTGRPLVAPNGSNGDIRVDGPC